MEKNKDEPGHPDEQSEEGTWDDNYLKTILDGFAIDGRERSEQNDN